MSKKSSNSSKVDFSNFLPSLFIIAFLLVGFVPNLSAVDKIAPQWLYLSILNFVSGIYLFYNRTNFSYRFFSVLSSGMGICYISFVFWASLSYFYAINPTEVLVNIVRHFNTLFMLLSLAIFLYNIRNKNRLVSFAITVILSMEVYAVLVQFFEMYNSTGIIKSEQLKGVTANRNITAFSIAIKLPYVLYLIFVSRKFLFKFLYSFLIFLGLFCLSIIESRASFLAAGVIGVLLFLWSAYLSYKEKSLKHSLLNLYYLAPMVFAIIANQAYTSEKGADALSRAATISFSTQDGSVNQRLRYYEDVLTHIMNNPILGVGIGNWKLTSIDYDKKDISGYIVPYHAHSDFIQLGAELGFIGFFLYLFVFIFGAYYIYIILFRSNLNSEEKLFIMLVACSLGVYGIDANLNFPIARPQVLAPWALTMALLIFHYRQIKKVEVSAKKTSRFSFFPFFLLIIMAPSIYITNVNYKSLIGQLTLLRDFNSNQYNVTLDKIDNITPWLPNITVTTIPMQAIKARYYLYYKRYDKAIPMLKEGISANPYLLFSENLLGKAYYEMGQIDSAFHYSKKAFYGLPNNALHGATYATVLSVKGDTLELNRALDNLSGNSNPVIWKNFIIAYGANAKPGAHGIVKRINKAVELYPNDTEIKNMQRLYVIGQEKINESNSIAAEALAFYNQGRYFEAAEKFIAAGNINYVEYSHFENAASAYFLAGDYGQSFIYLNRVIEEFKPMTGKSEYLKGLIAINWGDAVQACEMFNTSISYGYSQAQDSINQYCNN
tara:strand:- start:29433 stop:31760 length:2328 start_codon:yes stop_codon:yes gene_type:complete